MIFLKSVCHPNDFSFGRKIARNLKSKIPSYSYNIIRCCLWFLDRFWLSIIFLILIGFPVAPTNPAIFLIVMISLFTGNPFRWKYLLNSSRLGSSRANSVVSSQLNSNFRFLVSDRRIDSLNLKPPSW